MQQYHLYETIKEGKYSVIYKGRKRHTLQYVAVKKVPRAYQDDMLQTVDFLKNFPKHPNVVSLVFHSTTKSSFWVVVEYCCGGDLRSLLQADGCMEERLALRFAQDICEGLFFVHKQGVVFADLKPANILYDGFGTLKLGDFGHAISVSREVRRKHGVAGVYVAWELGVADGVFSFESDLYSLGVLLFEFITGGYPGQQMRMVNAEALQVQIPNARNDGITTTVTVGSQVCSFHSDQIFQKIKVSPAYQDLCSGLLQKDPCQRLPWAKIQSHEAWANKPLQSNGEAPKLLPHQPLFERWKAVRKQGRTKSTESNNGNATSSGSQEKEKNSTLDKTQTSESEESSMTRVPSETRASKRSAGRSESALNDSAHTHSSQQSGSSSNNVSEVRYEPGEAISSSAGGGGLRQTSSQGSGSGTATTAQQRTDNTATNLVLKEPPVGLAQSVPLKLAPASVHSRCGLQIVKAGMNVGNLSCIADNPAIEPPTASREDEIKCPNDGEGGFEQWLVQVRGVLAATAGGDRKPSPPLKDGERVDERVPSINVVLQTVRAMRSRCRTGTVRQVDKMMRYCLLLLLHLAGKSALATASCDASDAANQKRRDGTGRNPAQSQDSELHCQLSLAGSSSVQLEIWVLLGRVFRKAGRLISEGSGSATAVRQLLGAVEQALMKQHTRVAVRRKVAAAVGELLYYIASLPAESRWEVPSAILRVVNSWMISAKALEHTNGSESSESDGQQSGSFDRVIAHYAFKTFENIALLQPTLALQWFLSDQTGGNDVLKALYIAALKSNETHMCTTCLVSLSQIAGVEPGRITALLINSRHEAEVGALLRGLSTNNMVGISASIQLLILILTSTHVRPSNQITLVVSSLIRLLANRPNYHIVAKIIFCLVAVSYVHIDYSVWAFKNGLGVHIANLIKAKPTDMNVNQILALAVASLRELCPAFIVAATQLLTRSKSNLTREQLESIEYQMELPLQMLSCGPLANTVVASIVGSLPQFVQFIELLAIPQLADGGGGVQRQIMALVTCCTARLVDTHIDFNPDPAEFTILLQGLLSVLGNHLQDAQQFDALGSLVKLLALDRRALKLRGEGQVIVYRSADMLSQHLIPRVPFLLSRSKPLSTLTIELLAMVGETEVESEYVRAQSSNFLRSLGKVRDVLSRWISESEKIGRAELRLLDVLLEKHLVSPDTDFERIYCSIVQILGDMFERQAGMATGRFDEGMYQTILHVCEQAASTQDTTKDVNGASNGNSNSVRDANDAAALRRIAQMQSTVLSPLLTMLPKVVHSRHFAERTLNLCEKLLRNIPGNSNRLRLSQQALTSMAEALNSEYSGRMYRIIKIWVWLCQ